MSTGKSQIGLIGLAVMGQNLALNIAEKGFPISVWNRSPDKVDHTVARAEEEKLGERLHGYKDMTEFVQSIARPRPIIILVQAGKPVDAVIHSLIPLLDEGDMIIDGGNEWYPNTERRLQEVAAAKKLLYLGMGVSGGEEGARYGPSLMPGGCKEVYDHVEPILKKIAAQVDSGPCVTFIGKGGAGNYVKMIHNGIEYGDMQLIAESYDILKNVGGLTNDELAQVFDNYNQTELESFLIEITARIFKKRDDDGQSYVVDSILDKTGSKGTGKWTVQEAAENAVPVPTMSSALDARYISALLDQRRKAAKVLKGPSNEAVKASVNKQQLIDEVRQALYAAKICSYTQGMNLIKAAGAHHGWNLNLGEIARIWKGGCIIRARFLDSIKQAYDRNGELESLLLDEMFTNAMNERQAALRSVVMLSIQAGTTAPGFAASLGYYDSYRRDRLPANLTQAQRDFFGAHTYERLDKQGAFHTEWLKD